MAWPKVWVVLSAGVGVRNWEFGGTLCGCRASIYIHILYMNFGGVSLIYVRNLISRSFKRIFSSSSILVSIPTSYFVPPSRFPTLCVVYFYVKRIKKSFLESAHKLIFIYGIRNGHGTGVRTGNANEIENGEIETSWYDEMGAPSGPLIVGTGSDESITPFNYASSLVNSFSNAAGEGEQYLSVIWGPLVLHLLVFGW